MSDQLVTVLAALRRAREAYAFNPNSYTNEALRLKDLQPIGVEGITTTKNPEIRNPRWVRRAAPNKQRGH
jgi:hypothetical protein